MEIFIPAVLAFFWSRVIVWLAKRRQRSYAGWASVTFVAMFLWLVASQCVPSLSPGTGRVVLAVIGISGMVWVVLAPILIVLPRRGRNQLTASPESASRTSSPGPIPAATGTGTPGG